MEKGQVIAKVDKRLPKDDNVPFCTRKRWGGLDE
jgi:hypothetical protein